MQFLKVADSIFDFHLSPTELKVYLYLTRCQNCLATATVRIQTICTQCAIASANTVRNALDQLEHRGLIQRKQRHDSRGRCISSQFFIRQLESNGKWFRLWLGVQPFQMDKSAFVVYAYLCRQRVAYSGKAWPSQNTIAAAVGIARRTVCEALKQLVSFGAILKAALWKGRHNLYTVLQTCKSRKKGTPLEPFASTNEGDSQYLYSIFTLARLWAFVKTFILKVGCAIFEGQYLDLTHTPKKKEYSNKTKEVKRKDRGKCALF